VTTHKQQKKIRNLKVAKLVTGFFEENKLQTTDKLQLLFLNREYKKSQD
jgi:hypothetical protein